MFQPGANLYTQGFASRPENVEVPHYDVRVPSTSDILYPIGKEWIFVGNSIWKLLNLSASQGVTTANWVEISSSSGPIESVLGTASQVTVTTNSGTATVSLPSAITTPGSLTTTTSLTATLGNITATNGNLVLGSAGNKINIHATTAASDSVGTSAALDGASPSQLVVATTAVTASSKIFLSRATNAGTPGFLAIGTIVPGVSFQIISSANGDTSTVNYWIVN